MNQCFPSSFNRLGTAVCDSVVMKCMEIKTGKKNEKNGTKYQLQFTVNKLNSLEKFKIKQSSRFRRNRLIKYLHVYKLNIPYI